MLTVKTDVDRSGAFWRTITVAFDPLVLTATAGFTPVQSTWEVTLGHPAGTLNP